VAVLGVELFKEFVLDAKADWRDIVATLLGGLCVWVASCVVFGKYCAY
jgi:hypothetical protein